MLHRTNQSARVAARARRSQMRWAIVAFSALGLTIAYLDRAALSVAVPFMSEEFHISPAVQGVLLSSFFWTYALFQLPSG